jgi:hypothetical protein
MPTNPNQSGQARLGKVLGQFFQPNILPNVPEVDPMDQFEYSNFAEQSMLISCYDTMIERRALLLV